MERPLISLPLNELRHYRHLGIVDKHNLRRPFLNRQQTRVVRFVNCLKLLIFES